MATVQQVEPVRVTEWLVNEWDPRYSRATVTFRNATGATRDFPSGQTLKTVSGKYQAADTGACTGILVEPIYDLANNTDATAVIVYQGPVLVNAERLTFELSSTDEDTDPDVTAQLDALLALGIVALDEGTVTATL